MTEYKISDTLGGIHGAETPNIQGIHRDSISEDYPTFEKQHLIWKAKFPSPLQWEIVIASESPTESISDVWKAIFSTNDREDKNIPCFSKKKYIIRTCI